MYAMKILEAARQGRETLRKHSSSKVAYVQDALAAFTTEAAKLDDELNFIGHPEAVKRDFLVGAIMEERMSEEEFDEIFAALDTIQTTTIAC